MPDQIGTPEIIDIITVAGVVIIGVFGFWRGIVKELLITGGLLAGFVLAAAWVDKWADWLAENTTLGQSTAEMTVVAASVVFSAIVFGYVASYLADLPPADMPGRLGGFVLGCLNGLLLIAFLGSVVYDAILNDDQQVNVDETRILHWILTNVDWVILAAVGTGLVLIIASMVVRRRRAAYLPVTASRPGSSGYQPRRGDQPLAPEAEKIDPVPDPSTYSTWNIASPTSATVPLQRVADPTQGTDRPAPASAVQPGYPPAPSSEEIVRCISCGERISADDRFCPRCGRLLVH